MNTRSQALIFCTGVAALGAGVCAQAASAPQQIHIAGERIFPESLHAAPDGTVYIGSAGNRIIYRARPGQDSAEPWILPGADSPGILGVFVDAEAHTLWACGLSVGAPGQPPTTPSTLRAYDLTTGLLKGKYPIPTAGGTCNDIATGRDGTVYATDTGNMEIVRLRRGASALEVWAGNGGFGPKGGVLDGIAVLGDRVLVNALATSKLFAVPIAAKGIAGTITEIQLDKAIDRPDGMRSFGTAALLVAESGAGGRLSKVTLDGNKGKREILKEGWPDGPVAVAVVGETAYVLEGQLSLLRNTDPKVRPNPFKATAVGVGKP